MIAVSSIFVVIGVFAMRWNVVIGGQEISKSLSGTNTYVPVFFSQEGVFASFNNNDPSVYHSYSSDLYTPTVEGYGKRKVFILSNHRNASPCQNEKRVLCSGLKIGYMEL